MAIVTRQTTRFVFVDGELVVEIVEDDATGDLKGFQFTNTTSRVGEFSAMRTNGNGPPWRDRAEIPVGSSRMNVPNGIRSEDQLNYWTTLPGAKWS